MKISLQHIVMAISTVLLLTNVLPAMGQRTAVGTDIVNWAAGASMNISVEQALGSYFTLEGHTSYNPWVLKPGDRSLRHRLGGVGFRYWPCQAFVDYFVGLQGLYADYIIHNLPFINKPTDYRIDGSLWGGGLSMGYHFHLKSHWDMQLVLDISYVKMNYDKVECSSCKTILESGQRNYYGPTRIAVSFIYMID